MPIYAYRCSACGHAQDVLQKMSDPVLGTCPACGAETFVKQVTAAGFQLKGSGWYVTDFRGGNMGPKKAEPGEAEAGKTGEKADAKAGDNAAASAAGSADGSAASGTTDAGAKSASTSSAAASPGAAAAPSVPAAAAK